MWSTASREMATATGKQGNREMQIEWVYGPINGMYYLRFEGGCLDSVTSKRQQ